MSVSRSPPAAPPAAGVETGADFSWSDCGRSELPKLFIWPPPRPPMPPMVTGCRPCPTRPEVRLRCVAAVPRKIWLR